MVQPINYMEAMPQVDLGQSLLEGLRLGSTISDIQQKQAARQQEMLAKQQAEQRLRSYRGELESAFTQGTPQAFSRLMTLFPEHQAAIKPQFDQLSKDRQQGEISAALPVASALLSGNAKVAKDLIESRIKATPEGQDIGGLQELSNLIDVDPQTARNYTLMGLSRVMAPDKFAETFGKLAEAGRAEAMAPITLRKESADVVSKELENKFKPEKIAADLGLTKAQTEQAKAAVAASRAAAAKSGAEASRAQAEARQMGAGVIPLDKRPEAEAKFRKEYSDQTKGYQEVKSAYGRILAVSEPKSPDEEAAADLALIFNYMKMQDPGSTINSGEFANAQNAAGVPDRIKNMYNNLITGGRLNPSQRNAFKGQAKNLYEVAGQNEAIVRKGIERIATGYGLKTENIFYTPTEVAPTAPAPAAVPAATPTPAAPQPAQNRVDQLLKKYGRR